MTNLLITLAAEFTGKKAFKQAETSTEKLTKSVKNLSKTLGVAFGTAAVVQFGKASVQAAANDQRAQQQLALALKNVGLGRDAATSESFIQRLQTEFGVVDDKLRPAYQRLAVATHSTYESQKLMNIALDISASTGKDLDSVTSALSKAYLGSNTALSKLGVGISKADLKSKSFNDITGQLAVTFKGAATESANTFAGSMDKLGVASQNVKEIIGVGIIDSLKILSKDKTVSDLASQMENAATNIGDVLRGISLVIAEIKKIPGMGVLSKVMDFANQTSLFNQFSSIGAQNRRAGEVAKQKNPIQSGTYLNNPIAVATTKNTIAVTKLTAAQTAQTKLDKAKAMFDLKRIGIAAALTGNITGDSRTRLMALQAIENGDAANATKYSSNVNPNANSSITVNVTPQNLVSTKEDLVAQISAAMETARRRSGAGVGR